MRERDERSTAERIAYGSHPQGFDRRLHVFPKIKQTMLGGVVALIGFASKRHIGLGEEGGLARAGKLLALGLTLTAMSAPAQGPPPRKQTRDERCRLLSSAFVAKAETSAWHPEDYRLLRVEAFYSPVLDACIHAEIAEVGVYANIRDLSHTFFRFDPVQACFRMLSVGGPCLPPEENLLECDRNGANSVLVDKVRQYRGDVDTLNYAKWMDDGSGGLPRAVKTPETPYTKAQCILLYDRWITYLRRTPRWGHR